MEQIIEPKWEQCWKAHIERVHNGFIVKFEDNEKIVSNVIQQKDSGIFQSEEERKLEIESFKEVCEVIAEFFGIYYEKHSKYNIKIELEEQNIDTDN